MLGDGKWNRMKQTTVGKHYRFRAVGVRPDVHGAPAVFNRKSGRQDPRVRRATRDIEIVRTYADAGKSGLNIGGRLALQQMIRGCGKRHRRFPDSSWSTTSAAGGASRTPTRAPTTNISASAPVSGSPIAPSSSRTTARPSPRSSRASSARWPANTAASSPPRSSRASAG